MSNHRIGSSDAISLVDFHSDSGEKEFVFPAAEIKKAGGLPCGCDCFDGCVWRQEPLQDLE